MVLAEDAFSWSTAPFLFGIMLSESFFGVLLGFGRKAVVEKNEVGK